MADKQMKEPKWQLTRILADNIRTYRKSNQVSQEELADMCNLHRTYVGSVESGERNVTLKTLGTLAAALGVSVPELLTKRVFEDDRRQ